MHPLQCPRCKQPAFGALEKLHLGPRTFKLCRSCGQELSVAWVPYILVSLISGLLPLVGPLFAISFLGGSLLVASLSILAFALLPALWLHYRLVPLVLRSPRQAVSRSLQPKTNSERGTPAS